jgi:SAM-dependent methyltransferase
VTLDPTERFTDRAEVYARCRPGYPLEVLSILRQECGLTPARVIADVGCGTGLLTLLFLQNGNPVFGVEPNDAMRAQAEDCLSDYLRFTSVAGRSEATTLPDASVDFVTVAQAIHWFEPQATSAEFARLLRPDGWLAIVRNNRRTTTAGVAQEAEAALREVRRQPAHGEGRWDLSDDTLVAYFGPGGWQVRTCDHAQELDEARFLGLWESRSTFPAPGEPGHGEAMAELTAVFARHQRGGFVTVEYETEVYFGRPRR